MKSLPHALDRELVIRARRATVFAFLVDDARFARWLGAGSSIEARVGGAVAIVYPGGVRVAGTVLELVADERLVFTYGYSSGQPIPAGASRVTIALQDVAGGTRVTLRHEFADAAVRDLHVAGWRYQMAVFANLVCGEAHAGLAALCDRYFAAWAEADAALRRAHLQAAVSEDVEFRDAYGCVRGRAELEGHIAAVQQHMPGTALTRVGEPRQCQGSALVDWSARGPGGAAFAAGTNALELAPDGRLARVTGFWGAPPAAAG